MTNLKNLERKIIVHLNLEKSKNSYSGVSARIYNHTFQKAKEIVNEIFNDEYATRWLEDSEDKRIKEIIKSNS